MSRAKSQGRRGASAFQRSLKRIHDRGPARAPADEWERGWSPESWMRRVYAAELARIIASEAQS